MNASLPPELRSVKQVLTDPLYPSLAVGALSGKVELFIFSLQWLWSALHQGLLHTHDVHDFSLIRPFIQAWRVLLEEVSQVSSFLNTQ